MGKDCTITMEGSFHFRERQPTRRAYALSLSQSVPAQTARPTQPAMTDAMRRDTTSTNRQGMRMNAKSSRECKTSKHTLYLYLPLHARGGTPPSKTQHLLVNISLLLLPKSFGGAPPS
ncbi:unnamed protein product, partial [Ectocarpus sp. 8 AP-2014]